MEVPGRLDPDPLAIARVTSKERRRGPGRTAALCRRFPYRERLLRRVPTSEREWAVAKSTRLPNVGMLLTEPSFEGLALISARRLVSLLVS